MKDLGLSAGDLVEVENDNGATQAMVCPTPTARRKQAFMLFAYPMGAQGNVVAGGQRIDPSELQADLGQHSQACVGARAARDTSFKSWEFRSRETQALMRSRLYRGAPDGEPSRTRSTKVHQHILDFQKRVL